MRLLKSTANTRDLRAALAADGGRTCVRRETTGAFPVLRSDAPASLTMDELCWFKEHRVTTAVDLRTGEEASRRPNAFEKADGIVCFSCPISEGSGIPASPEAVPASYLAIAGSRGAAEAFGRIADAPEGVIFFCSAGKDRTGVLSAILLMLAHEAAACGQPERSRSECSPSARSKPSDQCPSAEAAAEAFADAAIRADYLESKRCLDGLFKRLAAERPEIDLRVVTPCEAHIDGFLRLFRGRYGSAQAYLSACGLTGAQIGRLSEKLTGE